MSLPCHQNKEMCYCSPRSLFSVFTLPSTPPFFCFFHSLPFHFHPLGLSGFFPSHLFCCLHRNSFPHLFPAAPSRSFSSGSPLFVLHFLRFQFLQFFLFFLFLHVYLFCWLLFSFSPSALFYRHFLPFPRFLPLFCPSL